MREPLSDAHLRAVAERIDEARRRSYRDEVLEEAAQILEADAAMLQHPLDLGGWFLASDVEETMAKVAALRDEAQRIRALKGEK